MVERQSFETTASFAFIASSASDSGSWTWLCARSLVDVARPKGKRPHFVAPTLVQSKMLNDRVGYLKVAMFPGMLGVDVSNARSSAVAELRNVERLTGNRRRAKAQMTRKALDLHRCRMLLTQGEQNQMQGRSQVQQQYTHQLPPDSQNSAKLRSINYLGLRSITLTFPVLS